MCNGLPTCEHGFKPIKAPSLAFCGKTCCQIPREGIPVRRRPKIGQGHGAPIRQLRCGGKIDTDTDNHAIAGPFEQNPGQFGPIPHQIVWPFQLQTGRIDHVMGYCFPHCQTCNQGKAGCQRITRPGPDEGRAHKVAVAIEPFPALPATARQLAIRNQPVPFCNPFSGTQTRYEIGIGRTGFDLKLDLRAQVRLRRTERRLPYRPASQDIWSGDNPAAKQTGQRRSAEPNAPNRWCPSPYPQARQNT